MRDTHVAYGALAVAALAGAWLLFVSLPSWYGPEPTAVTTLPALDDEVAVTVDQPDTSTPVTATLFYVSEDGMRLVGVEREDPLR